MMPASSIPLAQGDTIAGKYVVERVLGTGGMGIVVAARHEQLEQLVAIKLMRAEAVDNGDSVTRFLREARAAAKLKSEHVARVLDVGTLDNGAPYMVMEYLEGSDLAQVLATSGPMSIESTVRLMLQACEAVAEAHAAGIIHRDLKPQNLFLTHGRDGSPRLKVLDFGISKAIGHQNAGRAINLTGTHMMLGSPYYMAPEQMMSSRDVDERVDIWALGIVLFELLTGRCPFEADTMPGLCHKVVNEPPMPVSDLRADVPSGLCAVIEHCLMKDPVERFAKAEDLASALQRLCPLPRRQGREMIRVPPEGTAWRSSPSGSSSQGNSTPASWNSRSRAPSARRKAPTAVWTIASVLAAATLLMAVGSRHAEHSRGAGSAPEPTLSSVSGARSTGDSPSSSVPQVSTSEWAVEAGTLSPAPRAAAAAASSKTETSPFAARRAAAVVPVPARAAPVAKSSDAPAPTSRPESEADGIPTRR
jgi:serine/threonine-protein kinase